MKEANSEQNLPSKLRLVQTIYTVLFGLYSYAILSGNFLSLDDIYDVT